LPQKPWFDGHNTLKAFPVFSDRTIVSAGWKEVAGIQKLRSITTLIEDASICSEEPGSSGFGNFICAQFFEDSYCQVKVLCFARILLENECQFVL
jgi:hypothetical protein